MDRGRTDVVLRTVVCALCLAWSATISAAADATRTDAAKAAAGARYAQMASKSAALIAAADARGLAEHLRQLKSDASLNEAARERLLRETVLGLVTLTPQADIVTEVRALSRYRTKTWIIENEHGHPERYPAYDVAAAARFVEQRWREAAARKTAAAAIDHPDLGLIDRYVSGTATDRQGFEEAFAAAPADRVAIYADDLGRRLAGGEPVGGLARVVALASGDMALLKTVILEAPPRDALRALASIDPAGGPSAMPAGSMPILAAAVERDATASAALLRMAPLATTDPSTRRLLFDALGGRHGASAAAALARVDDPGIIDALADLLRQGGDEMQRRRALLALRLSDNARARDHLRSFAQSPDASAALLAEVPSWLRQ